jgi:hypothetical protein
MIFYYYIDYDERQLNNKAKPLFNNWSNKINFNHKLFNIKSLQLFNTTHKSQNSFSQQRTKSSIKELPT